MHHNDNKTNEKPQILKLSRRALKKIVGGRGGDEDGRNYVASRCPAKDSKPVKLA